MAEKNISCFAPGLAGIPVTESSISSVDGKAGKLEYRGIDIGKLAEYSSFEESSYLLIYGKLPTKMELQYFESELYNHRRIKFRIRDMIKCFPESAHPMDALQACVAALGMFYPLPMGLNAPSSEAMIGDSCVRLLAKMPTLVAAHARMRGGDDPIPPRDDLSLAANFLYMLSGKEPNHLLARIMDVTLIAHAEHTMNASTFSSLVTGSTLADPYTVISSAVGTLSGPLHGGANEEVLHMLDEIGKPEHAESYLLQKLRDKEKIPGLGHRVYKTKDPRAALLQRLYAELTEQYGSDPSYDIACRVEQVAYQHLASKGVYPNVDFFSGIVYRRMGIHPDLFTPIFAIARTAGWLSHWREQLQNNRIYRPAQIFIGQHNQPYIPIDNRTLSCRHANEE